MDSSVGFALANGISQNIAQEAVKGVCALGLLSCCDWTSRTTTSAACLPPAIGHMEEN